MGAETMVGMAMGLSDRSEDYRPVITNHIHIRTHDMRTYVYVIGDNKTIILFTIILFTADPVSVTGAEGPIAVGTLMEIVMCVHTYVHTLKHIISDSGWERRDGRGDGWG